MRINLNSHDQNQSTNVHTLRLAVSLETKEELTNEMVL